MSLPYQKSGEDQTNESIKTSKDRTKLCYGYTFQVAYLLEPIFWGFSETLLFPGKEQMDTPAILSLKAMACR